MLSFKTLADTTRNSLENYFVVFKYVFQKYVSKRIEDILHVSCSSILINAYGLIINAIIFGRGKTNIFERDGRIDRVHAYVGVTKTQRGATKREKKNKSTVDVYIIMYVVECRLLRVGAFTERANHCVNNT